MCLNCGCGMYEDDMGHPENITLATIKKAAGAEGQTEKEAMQNMRSALDDLLKKNSDK